MVLGAALHPLLQAARRNEWMEFVETSPERFYDSLVDFEASAAAEAREGLMTAASAAEIEEEEEVAPENYKVRSNRCSLWIGIRKILVLN